MPTLERAIEIAARAHAGVTDKAGMPYILHPLRVMLAVATPEQRMAAVLHDVVEDTDWTLDDLRAEGFPEPVVSAVDALTWRREAGEEYVAFVKRAAAHPVARAVKRADIEDNLDLSRIAAPTEKDYARLRRYEAALKLLRSA